MGIRTPPRYAARMPQPRQMTLIAFMQAQNCSNYVGSWRHPSSMTDSMSPEYYQRIARTLEDAKFDLAFFDDRLAMPDIYGNDHRETIVEEGQIELGVLERAGDALVVLGRHGVRH